jgi:hypothetical protein
VNLREVGEVKPMSESGLMGPLGWVENRTVLPGLAKVWRAPFNLAAGRGKEAISNTLEGAGQILTPAAIPAAIANPVATVGGLAGGLVGGQGAKMLADRLGASPETERLAEDAGGAAGGLLGGGIGKLAQPSIATMKALATDPASQRAAIRMIPFGGKFLSLKDALGRARAASEEPGLVDLRPSRAAVNPLEPPAPLPSRVMPPSRQLGPGLPLPPQADATKVTITTGDPLSYPGPRQLTAPQPGPTQNLRPPLRLGPGPDQPSRGLVDLGPAQGVSLSSGGFASGPQVEFVQPSRNLQSNPRALAAAQALQREMVEPAPAEGKLAKAAQRAAARKPNQ